MEEKKDNNIFCGECGAKVRGKFCPQCGSPVAPRQDGITSGEYSIVFDREDVAETQKDMTQTDGYNYYSELERAYEEEIKANERVLEKVKKEPVLKIVLISVAFFAVLASVILLAIFVPRRQKNP